MKQFIYWRTYHKGQILFMEDDPRERMYLLLDGFIKLENQTKLDPCFIPTMYVLIPSFHLEACFGMSIITMPPKP